MTGSMDEFEHLAAKARQESVPPLDIAEAVMARLQVAQRSDTESLWLFGTACSLASAAAVAAVAVATWSWLGWNDPLVEIFSQVEVVMQ